ncbi:hypothetical protein BDZ89DRAFT_1051865 [Hymenopellis radicata]|nr:hypothetical protein BDZ89DRAFT_1051865 [Hymenopellis radicata]
MVSGTGSESEKGWTWFIRINVVLGSFVFVAWYINLWRQLCVIWESARVQVFLIRCRRLFFQQALDFAIISCWDRGQDGKYEDFDDARWQGVTSTFGIEVSNLPTGDEATMSSPILAWNYALGLEQKSEGKPSLFLKTLQWRIIQLSAIIFQLARSEFPQLSVVSDPPAHLLNQDREELLQDIELHLFS